MEKSKTQKGISKKELLEKVAKIFHQTYPGADIYYLGRSWNIYCQPDMLANGYVIHSGKKYNMDLLQ